MADNNTVKDNVVTLGQEYMVFKLGGEDFGMNILEVVEIRGWERVTEVPNSKKHMRGVLNLRGAIVPVVDLRLRLNLEERAYDSETVVIVIRVSDADDEERIVGMAVDSVSDVIRAREEEIGGAPDFGSDIDTDFIGGLATTEHGMIRLLNLSALFKKEVALEKSE